MNFLNFHGKVAKGAKTVATWHHGVAIPAQREGASGDLVLGVRPEHIRLTDDSTYRGRILATEYLGTTQIITIAAANGELKARAPATQVARVGDTVGLGFNARH